MRDHYNDLIYTSLTLFNSIVDSLRKGTAGPDWIYTVLDASKVIKETTLMRELVKTDVQAYRQDLVHWHLDDDDKMLHRIPTKVDTFARFRNKKSCKVKDYAIEIVTKMYRIHQQDLQDSS